MADGLVALAEERGLVLFPGHLLLYHPGVTKLKAFVDSGELGRILYVYGNRQNLGQIRKDENALWSLGAHDLSVILHLVERGAGRELGARRVVPEGGDRGRRLLLPALPLGTSSRTCTSPGSTRTRCGR